MLMLVIGELKVHCRGSEDLRRRNWGELIASNESIVKITCRKSAGFYSKSLTGNTFKQPVYCSNHQEAHVKLYFRWLVLNISFTRIGEILTVSDNIYNSEGKRIFS